MKYAVCTLAIALAVVAGCERNVAHQRQVLAARAEDIRLTLSLSTTALAAGQDVRVIATAVNNTRRPLEITASTSALVIVRLWRQTPSGWTQVREYPETALQVLHPWTLAPGEQREFEWTLTVEPNWPPNEPLRMTAELNGHPARSAPVALRVTAATK